MNLFLNAKNLLDDEKYKVLLHRVQRGDLDYIKTVDPNVLLKARYGKDGNTVLMNATNLVNLDLCKEILKKCPSLLYQENYKRETVLHRTTNPFYFVSLRNFGFIDFFVSVGVDELETSNNEGDIYTKFKRWMKMQDVNGDTALVVAACKGNLHVVKRFIEVDRQYNLRLSKVVGGEGKTALDVAVEKEDHEMVKLLTDEGDPYSDFVSYLTAMDLFIRVEIGDLDYIKTVQLNVLLNSRDKHRMSVLCIATKWDQLDCCKEILKRCPSLLYHQNIYKCSVLHHAADLKIYRLIDFFVSAGLESAKSEGGTENILHFQKWFNLQKIDGNTAKNLAVQSYQYDIVKRFTEVENEIVRLLTGSGDPNLDYDAKTDSNIPISIAMQQAKEPLQTGNSSGSRVASEINLFTFAEVSKHNDLKDCWLLINDKAYDVTEFLRDHPGGSEVLLKATGKDATTDFKNAHSHSSNALTMMDKFYVGVCDSITKSLAKVASDKPQQYSWLQLKEFTKDFSQPLGSGGFGDIYKGQFPDGVFIAVKVLKNIELKEKVMREQFVAEVDTMGRAYHHNLIKLHGYCYEANTKYKALVYDYMENGSFDKILFEKKLDISWAKLHNIAKEIAQGISYLHEGCNPRIIHQDIKPANVLIDSNLSPKVIDFGLAKVINIGESQFEQTNIKGSRGYMAPEVNQQQKVKLSSKLDVYSFGMMLFDILGSQRNHVDKRLWFPGQVWEMYKAGQLEKFILDCGIKEEDKKKAKRLATIALLCVEHNPRTRPKLSNVVKMLEGEIIQLENPVVPFSRDYVIESCSMSDTRDY